MRLARGLALVLLGAATTLSCQSGTKPRRDAPESPDVGLDTGVDATARDAQPGSPDAADDGPPDAGGDADRDAAAVATPDAGSPFPTLQPHACLRYVTAPAVDLRPIAQAPAALRRWAPLTVLLDAAGLEDELEASPEARALAAARRELLLNRDEDCAADRGCWTALLAWTDADRAAAAEVLAPFFTEPAQAAALEALIARVPILPLPSPFDAPTPLEKARALVDRHADVQDAALALGLQQSSDDTLRTILADPDPDQRPGRFDATTNGLLERLMRGAGRDEPLRYAPLAAGENAAAAAALSALTAGNPNALTERPFIAILVPGQGPNDPDLALTGAGAARADLAVARWQAGVAHFLLFSGGHVHPDRTRFSEALEMKRYVMETHGVPESAILVDPYARHTTTNLRNAARVLAELGVSLDHTILITSDRFQTVYIAQGMAQRSQDELGYLPWRTIAKLGDTDSCAVLSPDSMRADPADPLDP